LKDGSGMRIAAPASALATTGEQRFKIFHGKTKSTTPKNFQKNR
jgi:hypothetical protein